MGSSLSAENSYDNNVNKYKQLITHCFDVLRDEGLGGSFLYRAIDLKKLETVELLLKNGANPNAYCHKDFKNNKIISQPLILLLQNARCSSAGPKIFRFKGLGGQDLGRCCSCTDIKTAERGDTCVKRKILELLINYGADTNITNDEGDTPLHLVCNAEQGYNLCLTWLLIEKGANVNALNYDKKTPLYLAIKRGNLDIVRSLLKHDADQYITSDIDDKLLSGIGKKKKILKLLDEYSVRDKIKLMHRMRKFERYAFHDNYCSLDIFNYIIKLLLA